MSRRKFEQENPALAAATLVMAAQIGMRKASKTAGVALSTVQLLCKRSDTDFSRIKNELARGNSVLAELAQLEAIKRIGNVRSASEAAVVMGIAEQRLMELTNSMPASVQVNVQAIIGELDEERRLRAVLAERASRAATVDVAGVVVAAALTDATIPPPTADATPAPPPA